VPNVGGGGTFRGWGLVGGRYVIGDKLSEGTRIVLVGLSVLQEGYLKKKQAWPLPSLLGLLSSASLSRVLSPSPL
jgi:hypothetical protein